MRENRKKHIKSDTGFSRFTFWIYVSSKAKSNVPAVEDQEGAEVMVAGATKKGAT